LEHFLPIVTLLKKQYCKKLYNKQRIKWEYYEKCRGEELIVGVERKFSLIQGANIKRPKLDKWANMKGSLGHEATGREEKPKLVEGFYLEEF
jgi:hypothetical protein